jgi:hypothetical protein
MVEHADRIRDVQSRIEIPLKPARLQDRRSVSRFLFASVRLNALSFSMRFGITSVSAIAFGIVTIGSIEKSESRMKAMPLISRLCRGYAAAGNRREPVAGGALGFPSYFSDYCVPIVIDPRFSPAGIERSNRVINETSLCRYESPIIQRAGSMSIVQYFY